MHKEQQLLPFISNAKLFLAVETVLTRIKNATKDDRDFYKNSVDPFSAIFDASSAGISLKDWIGQEKARQRQKTLQNAVGEFHKVIIGSVTGWENLPVGKIIDVENIERKIIAEIKNKYNTTKGSDKKGLYDNLKFALKGEYKGYIAYYVEIIPKSGAIYNKTFKPSDNKTKVNRKSNKNIRRIDGSSFYEIVTGDKNALEELYNVLPTAICKIQNGNKSHDYSLEPLFHKLYNKAFKNNKWVTLA
ncbi:Eco47II family restriction endonuclease [Candidatus Parcubacteria bacterium]|nr:Eco47II family restriction endonuclease [Patescibacteria group bacterium]MCG2688918.1 Eco47II family restriction endonuclease [Candidatus Parcubacteria bacterium]